MQAAPAPNAELRWERTGGPEHQWFPSHKLVFTFASQDGLSAEFVLFSPEASPWRDWQALWDADAKAEEYALESAPCSVSGRIVRDFERDGLGFYVWGSSPSARAEVFVPRAAIAPKLEEVLTRMRDEGVAFVEYVG